MRNIGKIIDSLSPVDKAKIYFALRGKQKNPEYTISKDEHGCYISSHNGLLGSLRFEKKEYVELAYQIYKNMNQNENLMYNIRSVFRLLNIDSKWSK